MIKLILLQLKKSYRRLIVRVKSIFGISRTRVTLASNLVIDIRHNDLFGQKLLVGNYPEPEVTTCLTNLVKPGMKVLDIGANIGYMSLICSQCVGGMGRIISFEPNPIMLQELRHNLNINKISNCTVEPIALSDVNGIMNLVLPEKGKESHSSLRPNSTFTTIGTIAIKTETLDSVVTRLSLKEIDVIKMDVEGAELLVLKGSQKVLSKMRPVILFESAENLTEAFGHSVLDVLSLLRSHKYKVKQISYGNWLAIPE